MGFNGKSLVLIGTILFIFQIANFFSIETITPQLERAQVLAAIASLIIILIGFLFKQFEPLAGEKAVLKGENKFLFDKNIPDEVIDEHGLKIQRTANEKGIEPKSHCDEISEIFNINWKNWNISFDQFIRTSSKNHELVVNEFYERV